MTTAQVRAVLGEPDRVIAGSSLTAWLWGEYSASVNFTNGKLSGWSEPRE